MPSCDYGQAEVMLGSQFHTPLTWFSDSRHCGLRLSCNLSAAVMQTSTMIPWGFCCRPESRQGRLPTSQLGGPRAVPGLLWEQAQLAATHTQTEPAIDMSLYIQSDRQPEEAAGVHRYSQSGMQSRGQEPASSNNCPDVQSEQAVVSMDISLPCNMGQQIDVHTAENSNSSSMSVVEAAALAASSPGAVVRVPTSTTLSQADQIALRYQHQVSKAAMRLQSAVKSATAVVVTLHASGVMLISSLHVLHSAILTVTSPPFIRRMCFASQKKETQKASLPPSPLCIAPCL